MGSTCPLVRACRHQAATASRRSMRLQAVLSEPMAHSRLAPSDLLSYLSDGSAHVDQLLQVALVKVTLRLCLSRLTAASPCFFSQ
jgi:hypothetical protein